MGWFKKSNFVLVGSWMPPMKGGPKNLFNLVKDFDPKTYVIATSHQTLSLSKISEETWLNVPYYFFDLPQQPKSITNKKIPAAPDSYFNRPTMMLLDFLKFLSAKLKRDLATRIMCELMFLGIACKIAFIALKHRSGTIIAISDKGPALIGSFWASRFLNLRYCPYFYDLYADNNFEKSEHFRIYAKKWESKILSQSSLFAVTNEETEHFYQKKYGAKLAPTIIVRNTVPDKLHEKWEPPALKKRPLKIVFTGHIYWAHLEAFRFAIESFKKFSADQLSFHIYTMEAPHAIVSAVAGFSQFHLATASMKEIPAILEDADFLYLPFSYNVEAKSLIQTASPAKLTEYLAAGRPLLVHAPPNSFVYKTCKHLDLGVTLSSETSDFLDEFLTNLIKDNYDWFSQNQIKWAHNARAQYLNFYRTPENLKSFRKLLP
jgi:hypothetical protein